MQFVGDFLRCHTACHVASYSASLMPGVGCQPSRDLPLPSYQLRGGWVNARAFESRQRSVAFRGLKTEAVGGVVSRLVGNAGLYVFGALTIR